MAKISTNIMLDSREEKTYRYKMYLGPKEYKSIRTLGHNLDKAIDFGFFGVLAKAALWVLYRFYNLTGNYGW